MTTLKVLQPQKTTPASGRRFAPISMAVLGAKVFRLALTASMLIIRPHFARGGRWGKIAFRFSKHRRHRFSQDTGCGIKGGRLSRGVDRVWVGRKNADRFRTAFKRITLKSVDQKFAVAPMWINPATWRRA